MSKLGLAITLGLTLAGCGNGDDDAAPANQTPGPIEIQGTWTNDVYGETDVIDDESWSSAFAGSDPSLSRIVEFSNNKRYAIRKAPDDAAFNPGTYDRVVWTKPANGEFYYCTVTYGCDTPELTATGDGDEDSMSCNLSTVDASDPANGGCGDFAWTKLASE